MNAPDYYGRGMSFPIALTPTGSIAESTGAAKVYESILIILGTQYGERAMRPTFGCNLKSLAFAPNNAATASLARYYVQQGLQQWEPRINVLSVDVENDELDGSPTLLITVNYQLRATQDVQSLIYPFNLEQTS